jgi:hypothetical protein
MSCGIMLGVNEGARLYGLNTAFDYTLLINKVPKEVVMYN